MDAVHHLITLCALALCWVSALALAMAGIVQLGRCERRERTVRSAVGAVMCLAAGLLVEALVHELVPPALAPIVMLLAGAAVWLVSTVHTHPTLVRISGWGELDPPGQHNPLET